MYRVGFCPSCDEQIMVRNTDGRWNSFKSIYAQAHLVFGGGIKVRTIICKNCLGNSNIDLVQLKNAIVDDSSEATTAKMKEYISSLGAPIGLEPYLSNLKKSVIVNYLEQQ